MESSKEEALEGIPLVELIKAEALEKKTVLDSLHENQQENEDCVDNHSIKDVNNQNNDPYAYLEKTGFTSEKFKIEVRNLPKYYGLNVSMPCLFKLAL